VIAADPSAALQAALDRARHAEDVSSKLTRLLKIRELQLEKQQLESSRITDELRKSEESSTRLADELRRSEEKSLAQQGAAERDRERLERRFNELNKQLTEEKARSAALASASNSSVQSARAKADNAEATALALVAKDQQIAAVMAEGAELQRKQQKLEIIIKKLREEIAAKEEIQKKSDAERESQEKRLADRTAKFTDLKERYSRVKEDLLETNQRLAGMESKLLETESLLSSSTSTVSDLRYSLQHAQDEKREKENALLKVQHELAQQHKTKAHSSEELEQLKAKDVEAQEREANLLRNVQEMNDALQAERAERAAREEVFQVELQAERTKLSDAEHRNEELLSAVPAATRPLLRQIESYASALQSSKEAWAGVEAQLNRRVHELELQLVHASREAKEHESSSRESALELADTQSRLNTVQEKLTALESAHRTLKSQYRTLEENSRDSQGKQEDLLHQILTLTAANDDLKSKVRSLTEGNASQERKWEGLYQSERQRSEKMEKEVEQLRAAGVSAGQSINTSDSSRDENKLESSPRSSVGGSSSADPWGSSNGSSSVAPLFGSDKLAVTSTVEMLRSLLHQKEGEIRSLKEINRQVESGRSSLSDELVLLTSQLNAASIGLARLPPLEAQLASLTQRYDAAVLLLGEKEETIDDLQQDVAEMKSVFQSQVEQLTTTIQELKKQKA
jgi:chromosome segregation ATPase